MKITLANGRILRGDLLIRAVLRRDLAPIPATLEADIASDESMELLLACGQLIQCAADWLHIIHCKRLAARQSQGTHERAALRITALLADCHKLAFVRERAVIKENTALSIIYRACGAQLKQIQADASVSRFSCLAGQVPTFALARVLEESGLCASWQEGYLYFLRVPDLFNNEPILTLPDSVSKDLNSGFLEYHSSAQFFSLNAHGEFIHFPMIKARPLHFMPLANSHILSNLKRPLIQNKTVSVALDLRLHAGQIVDFVGGQRLVIVTVAHYLTTGTDTGTGGESYSKLWLAYLPS